MAESNIDRQKTELEQLTVDSELEETADEIIEETPEMSPTFDFKEQSWMTDFTLVAEGTKFYVAKTILALASPVFKRMFESGFKEKASEEFGLEGKRAEDVNEFLLAVYPSADTVSNLSKEKALKVLPLAEEYQVLTLKRRCEDALLGSIDDMTSTEEMFRLIKESHLYTLSSLYERCINSLTVKSVDEIEKANKDILLPAEPLREIIQNLISKMRELELASLHKTEELETNETWGKYFAKAIKKSDVPKIYKELNVIGKSSVVTMNIVNRNQVKDYIMLSETNLKLHFEVKFDGMYGYTIFANLELSEKRDSSCNIFIQFVVVNRMPFEEHLPVNHKVTVKFNQPENCRVVALNQIADPKKGFVVDEKIQLEINVFMSKLKKA